MTDPVPYAALESQALTPVQTIPDLARHPETDVPNDLFDIFFATDDGVSHTEKSVTAARFSKHTLHDKALLVVSLMETHDGRIKEFLDHYQHKAVTLTFIKYNVRGETVKTETWATKMLDAVIAHDGSNVNGILAYEFLFLEA